MKQFVVLAVALVAVTAVPFCPGEGRNGKNKRCVSNANQYKCGVFMEELISASPITWLGALPDALAKVDSQADIDEILGENITPASFENFSCDDVAANSRCYATMSKFKSDPLDSCDKNLVNTKSSQTIGDYLCQQVRRWLRRDEDFKVNGRDNIRIPIYYSQCGEDWKPVSDDGQTLYVDEPLCCTPDGSFRRCDGSDYRTSC